MSRRAIRKFQTSDEISPIHFSDKDDSDVSAEEDKSTNKFTALLGNLPSDVEHNTSIESGPVFSKDNKVSNTKSKQNNAKRRRKKKSNRNAIDMKNEMKEDEIDRCVREVNAMLGEVTVKSEENHDFSREKEQDVLLSVSRKFLDPIIEMKRIFGAKVVENERSQKRHNGSRHDQGRQSRKCVIISEPPPFPGGHKSSLSMEVEMEYEGSVYYRFVHLPSYQKTQLQFNKVVNTIAPEVLMNFMDENPLHVDSLLTAAEIYRLAEDPSTSSKILQRAICVMEDGFHPQFTYATGKCRMNYRQQENRAFFIAIFRYILHLETKGCSRTCLELCKILLNLSPDTDPLGVSLMMDYYAIRAKEYAWLVSIYDCYKGFKNLSMLPNFSFSVPLALYHLSNKKQHPQNKESSQYKVLSSTPEELRERSDKMLQDCLIMFPAALTQLLDKCSVKADDAVLAHPYFGYESQSSMTKGLSAVIKLFVGRNFYLWKETAVMHWLEENVKKTIERVDKDDPLVAECEIIRKSRYLGTPNPIYRHIIIAEIKDVTVTLPDAIAKMPLMSHDPLPPPDNVCGYKMPKKPRSRDAESVVSSFFRSLMPTYDTTGPPMSSSSEDENGEDGENGSQIRESVQTIIDGLRNLAATIRRENPNEPQEQDEPAEQ